MSGYRRMLISTDLIASMLKPQNRNLRIESEDVPADMRVVRIVPSAEMSNAIEALVKSDEWEGDDTAAVWVPMYRVVSAGGARVSAKEEEEHG